MTFHDDGQPEKVPSSRGVTTFDDSDPDRYWSADNPWGSTKVAGSGTSIRVLAEQSHKDQMVVQVRAGTKE